MLRSKDILGIRDLSFEEIIHILETAKDMKERIENKNKRKKP